MNFKYIINKILARFMFEPFSQYTVMEMQTYFDYLNHRFLELNAKWKTNPVTKDTWFDVTYNIEDQHCKMYESADLYRMADIQPFIEPYNIPQEYQIFEFVMIPNTWKYYKEFTSEMLFRVIEPIDTSRYA